MTDSFLGSLITLFLIAGVTYYPSEYRDNQESWEDKSFRRK